MRLRNKETGTSVTVGDVQGEKMLAKGWVLASKYKAPAIAAGKAVAPAAIVDPEVLAEAVAAELARLGITPEPVTIPEASAIDSPDGVNANPPEDEPAGDSDDDKPVKRGQTRRTTK